MFSPDSAPIEPNTSAGCRCSKPKPKTISTRTWPTLCNPGQRRAGQALINITRGAKLPSLNTGDRIDRRLAVRTYLQGLF